MKAIQTNEFKKSFDRRTWHFLCDSKLFFHCHKSLHSKYLIYIFFWNAVHKIPVKKRYCLFRTNLTLFKKCFKMSFALDDFFFNFQKQVLQLQQMQLWEKGNCSKLVTQLVQYLSVHFIWRHYPFLLKCFQNRLLHYAENMIY